MLNASDRRRLENTLRAELERPQRAFFTSAQDALFKLFKGCLP
jgi:hypothetical protein